MTRLELDKLLHTHAKLMVQYRHADEATARQLERQIDRLMLDLVGHLGNIYSVSAQERRQDA